MVAIGEALVSILRTLPQAGENISEWANPRAALGAGLIRDGHGPRALETLVRYRGAVLAELAPLSTDLGGR